MAEQNRKTLRSFYCLDALWSIFEAQTHEYGVSMDYLINEAMTQYADMQGFASSEAYNQTSIAASIKNARQSTSGYGHVDPRGQSGTVGLGASMSSAINPPPMGHATMNPGISSMGSGMGGNLGNQSMGPPGVRSFGPQGNYPNYDASQPVPPPGPRAPFAQGPGVAPPGPVPGPAGGPAPGPWNPNTRGTGFGSQMQPPPQPPRPQQGPTSNVPVLYLYFDNNRYTIGTEDFVIGRGSQRTDLTIRDGNISRRHCAILHRNGAHYIKDLGSTNGVEFQGNRIESKKISEGDVYYLCDYELRFSYQ